MMSLRKLKQCLASGALDKTLIACYGSSDLQAQKGRCEELINLYQSSWPSSDEPLLLFSTPGRSELAGNHTDHNHGLVLTASLSTDTLGLASKRSDRHIQVRSTAYPSIDIDLGDKNNPNLDPQKAEKGKAEALIRGVVAGQFKRKGRIGGFNLVTQSQIPPGAGFSSSAAFEVLIGGILNELYENSFDLLSIAQMGQYAENHYFGKPCGLMDQLSCALGGVVQLDFENPSEPQIKRLDVDFKKHGYTLVAVDTGGNHAELIEDYAAISGEMFHVAQLLGKRSCRSIHFDELLKAYPLIKEAAGDRAFLRVFHFIKENHRVQAMYQRLYKGQIEAYLALVRESGASSWCYLQNVFSAQNPQNQGSSLALALSEDFLQSKSVTKSQEPRPVKGACRIHGGGFAGSIQAYIPSPRLEEYRRLISKIFGDAPLLELRVREASSRALI